MDVDFNYSLLDYATYNDYLNSFVTAEDRRFVNSLNTITTLVKLGYRSKYMPYSEEEFLKRRALSQEAICPKIRGRVYFSDYLTNNNDEFLNHLKERERLNGLKVISTIIFLTYRKIDGSELTGYIDFEQSCRSASLRKSKATHWQKIFQGRLRLRPKPNHLSYHNSHNNEVIYNDSDNFIVIHDHDNGLIFMHRGDHKPICVGPNMGIYANNAKRTVTYSPKHGYVVLYDHKIRKKN